MYILFKSIRVYEQSYTRHWLLDISVLTNLFDDTSESYAKYALTYRWHIVCVAKPVH